MTTQFALVVESGPLEAQALLLVESLRRFGGRHADAPVVACSPRPARRPASGTVRKVRALGVEYVELDVDGACPDYPTSWRIHVVAELERRDGPEVLVQLDNDALITGDLGPLCADVEACARPVDVKGMGSTGPGDEYEPIWQSLCALAGVAADDLGWATSTVDRQRIRAVHNGGFVAARRDAGVFGATEEVFRHAVAAGLRPFAGRGLLVRAGAGEVGAAGDEWWGLAQAAASVAAATRGITIAAVGDDVNVPVHLWDRIADTPAQVTHVHYHHHLASPLPSPNPLLDGDVPLGAEVAAWLRDRVPLPATGRRRGFSRRAAARPR